jgi:hypothetical protein
MIKAPISLPELRRRIYRKAKSDKTHRFWGIFVHIAKIETLKEAYRIAKRNGGAPGIDGQTFEDIEAAGLLPSGYKTPRFSIGLSKYSRRAGRSVYRKVGRSARWRRIST